MSLIYDISWHMYFEPLLQRYTIATISTITTSMNISWNNRGVQTLLMLAKEAVMIGHTVSYQHKYHQTGMGDKMVAKNEEYQSDFSLFLPQAIKQIREG